MSVFKYWKNFLHPVAIILGAWGGFPKPPQALLDLTKFELFRWFLVFVIAYQGGPQEDVKTALIVTVALYLITKLFELRDITSAVPLTVSQTAMQQQVARNESAVVQAAQQAAQQAAAQAAAEATAHVTHDVKVAETAAQSAAAKTEKFFGGYYM